MTLSAFLGGFIPVFLSMLIPGILVAFPLLRKRLGIVETIAVGLCLGFILPAFMLFAESFAGLNYSYPLALADIALLSLAGLAWGIYTKSFPGISDFKIKLDRMGDLRPLLVPTLLVLLMVFAFFACVQSLSGYGSDGRYYAWFELDPYYYMYSAQDLLTEGKIPAVDYTAWDTVTGETCGYVPISCGNPQKMLVCEKVVGGHHGVPLSFYAESIWYSVYTNGGPYNNLTLATVGGAYPAFAAALLVFGVYLLVSTEYGRKMGLAAGGLVAFMPAVILKMAAGENDIQPWGEFSIFLALGAYAMAIKKKDMRFAVLAAIAYVSVTTGSAFGVLLDLVLAGYIGLQAIADYLRKDEEGMLIRLKINFIMMAGVVITALCLAIWGGGPIAGFTSDFLELLGAFAFSVLLTLLTVSPGKLAGEFRWFEGIKTQVADIVKIANDPENRIYILCGILAVGILVLAVTPFGAKIIASMQNAANYAQQCTPLTKTIAEQTASPSNFEGEFGFIGKDLSQYSDVLGVFYFPMHIAYSLVGIDIWDAYSLAHMLVFITAFALIYSIYRKSPTAILFLVMILPVAYVGFNRSKYIFQLGVVVAVAFTIIFGELIFLIQRLGEKWKLEGGTIRAASWGVYLFVALVVLLEAGLIIGGPATDLIPYMFKPRYHENPAAYPGAADCTSAYGGKAVPTQLYCSDIPDYWMDSMSFLKTQTPANSTVMAWWDYGHWINFFGERNAVIRNEHAFEFMEQEVADDFVQGTPEDLAQYMNFTKSKYVLFDEDLIQKWGALDYLSCEFNNETNVTANPGQSQCEAENSPEMVYVPTDPQIQDYCDVQKGVVLGRSSFGTDYCIQVVADNSTGSQALLMYYANDYKNGVMHPNRGFLLRFSSATIGGRDFASFMVLYMNQTTWYDGQNGWADRKGKFYDSNFYKGFFLGQLPGFKQVYPVNTTGEGFRAAVRIYQMDN